MTEKEQELSKEIARLTGQIVGARATIALLFKAIAIIDARSIDLLRDFVNKLTIVSEGSSDDNLRREGLEHFKQRLMESLTRNDRF